MNTLSSNQARNLEQRAELALEAGEPMLIDPLELLALLSGQPGVNASSAGRAPAKPKTDNEAVTETDLVNLLGKCVEAAGVGYLLGEVYPEEMEVYGERLLEFCLEAKKKHQWPTERTTARLGDMSPHAYLRIDLDADNDACLSIWNGSHSADVEFCCPGAGGGQSRFTREALINLMLAMEKDNAERPSRDWMKQSNPGKPTSTEGG
ncbi:hypothetical protein ACSVIJ_05425 [Pseudomonas sp. NCHU5208]|uniref:hypothetical protein n=1 Tax=unclassified Pseudomonas TaxID=196821 RepID=UPI003F9A1137